MTLVAGNTWIEEQRPIATKAVERVGLEADIPVFAGADRPLLVAGERDELLRVAENLIENAVKYGQDGKRVEVVLDSVEDPPGCPQARLSVRDFGLSMRPEDTERVFDRFWRADPSRKRTIGGTGLGLSIALGDAKLHGGSLEVWSKLGRGTNFVLTLPRQGRAVTGASSPIPVDPCDDGAPLDDLGLTQPIELPDPGRGSRPVGHPEARS